MKPAVLQRLFALSGLALVAAVVALAATRENGSSTGALPPPGGQWFTALAGPQAVPTKPRRTACGHTLNAQSLGVAHPVLPCNVKIYVEFGHKTALTEVIDRGPNAPGREFNVTHALAEKIGLHSVQPIRWRFATTTTPG